MNVRQIVLDTETTGLDIAEGHRIIEIGCVELVNRRLTRNNFHQYLNPDRKIDDGALAVHGITGEFLQNKPRFSDIVQDFLSFIRDAELVIHNADFDVGFINCELKKISAKLGEIGDYCTVLDTLKMARQAHPGQRNDLDALCKRYEIDSGHRDLHGALLDAEILADVYLAMTGGQTTLLLDEQSGENIGLRKMDSPQHRAELTVIYADKEELVDHEDWLKLLDEKSGGQCLWRTIDQGN